MVLNVADYFVKFLIENGVTDVFGYQGGMIAYIFDSLGRYKENIEYHSCATEQGAALAACGYAQATGNLGVAISTSGPGFTNLLTGIADAWFDSLPVLFLSGNVNTKDKKRERSVRQLGFQEIQTVPMASGITKKTYEMELGSDYVRIFNDAYLTAMSGRKGPVFIDLPINICREEIEVDCVRVSKLPPKKETILPVKEVIDAIKHSKKPVVIAGAGIKQSNSECLFKELINVIDIPVVTTLPAIDLLPTNVPNMMGYIGGTGRREAGVVLQNADFVLTIGTRLCSKQIGHNMSLFANKAEKIIRIDIDDAELERKLKSEEIQIKTDIEVFMKQLLSELKVQRYVASHANWMTACAEVSRIMAKYDMTEANWFAKNLTNMMEKDANIVLDVGKNMTYFGQSSVIRENSKIFMSAGLGTMGYALPAAIGAYLGNGRPTYAIMGDGGAQMNIQELNIIAKKQLPIKIIVLNNRALGNICIFQSQYLHSRYVATMEQEGDYFSCDFAEIAKAYGIDSVSAALSDVENLQFLLSNDKPVLIQIDYKDCEVLPGIVAGGDYLSEKNGMKIEDIEKIQRAFATIE